MLAHSSDSSVFELSEAVKKTAHILPKGFFVAALPSIVVDKNFNLFSLGIGAGKALTKNIAITGGYVHYVLGARTLNQGFAIAIQYLALTED